MLFRSDDSGRVVAAIGKNSDGYVKLIANKAVIIAAGDYQNNENMVKALSPDVARFGRKQSGRTGDGILMAALAGGRICPVNHAKTMHDMDAQPMLLTRKPFMALDESGKRFMNEDIPMESWDLTLRERSLDTQINSGDSLQSVNGILKYLIRNHLFHSFSLPLIYIQIPVQLSQLY